MPPTIVSVRPLPPASGAGLEPYRVLFPLGAACAIAGVVPWIAFPFGNRAWPGLLKMAIGTRVVVSHGSHNHDDEARVLGVASISCIALALATRLASGELDPSHSRLLATSATLWTIAWSLSLTQVLRRVR